MNEVAWSNSMYESIARTIGARTGLKFHPHQCEQAEQGIRNAMAQAGLADLSDMARRVEHERQILDCLIVELTVGETYFLREPAQWEFIRRRVLPDVVHRKGPDHKIRIWSAGCASGEEPYSLAMLCTDMKLAGRSQILATDISKLALKKARAGSYRPWSLRGTGAEFARSYLRRDGEVYRVEENIRRMVQFEHMNLVLDVYPSLVTGTQAMDLILCRNVMIYFDLATIKAVAKRLYQCLSDGGWLMTASGDPAVDEYAPFEPVVTDEGVYYRKPVASTCLDDAALETDWPERSGQFDSTPGRSATLGHTARRNSEISRSNQAEGSKQREAGVSAKEVLTEASAALDRGDYARAVDLTVECLDDARACVMHVNALANVETSRARQRCAELAARHSLSAELHYLHAVLSLETNRENEAISSAERAVYVDPTLAIVHFLLGSIYQRRGDFQTARRAFRNAKNLCDGADPDGVLPLSDGETAGHLAEAADRQLTTIDAALETADS